MKTYQVFSSFFLTPFLDVIYLTSKETTEDLCIYGNICSGKEKFMRQLAKDIDHFLNEIILKAETSMKSLLVICTSNVTLTNTQEHILMLLSEESLTNRSWLAVSMSVKQLSPRPLSP